MKYQFVDNVLPFEQITVRNVAIQNVDGSLTGFPAVVGNPNYDQFLVQAELTDKQVHALTPDVWYDFPEAPTV